MQDGASVRGMRLLITGGSGFIGTNAVGRAMELGIEVLNVDCAPPKTAAHASVWRECDIRDDAAVERLVAAFDPTHALHLAARTDLRGASLDDYSSNTRGTENVVRALGRAVRLERAIFTSSMLVCPNGVVPEHDMDYRPNTPYGESKVRTELVVRRLHDPAFAWCIVRPTSIWGPWFDMPYRPFFEMVVSGRYVHPGPAEVYKHMGFVGNTVEQLFRLLEAPGASFHGNTYYLGDYERYSTRHLAETIRREAGARPIRQAPLPVLRAAAAVGDAASWLGWSAPPLTSFRLRNMLTSSQFDLSRLMDVTGPLPASMEKGVAATLEWLAWRRPSLLCASSC